MQNNLEYEILSYHIMNANEKTTGRKNGAMFFLKTKKAWFSTNCQLLYDIMKQCYDTNTYEYMNITESFIESYPNKQQFLMDILTCYNLSNTIIIDIYYKKLQKKYLLEQQRKMVKRLHYATSNNKLININQDEGIYDISQFLQQSKENTISHDKNIKEWIEYYKENQKNTTQYELGIDFLDEALQGGIESYQLVLIIVVKQVLDCKY